MLSKRCLLKLQALKGLKVFFHTGKIEKKYAWQVVEEVIC